MGFNNIFNRVNNFINSKKSANELYKQKLSNSSLFQLNYDIVQNNDYLVEGHWYDYCNMCPNLNIDKAKIIDSVIPINETVINIIFCTQKINNENFFIVFTNYRWFIFSNIKYMLYKYEDIKIFELINKSLMTQIVNLNGVILGLDISQKDLNIIYSLIYNLEYRNYLIKEKISYLCGINPIYQKLSRINSGISIDKDNNIVFHDKKEKNYICKYQDILNYELLEDNVAVLSRRTKETNHSMRFGKKECNRMCLRITLKNNQIFNIDILEPTMFGTSYLHTDKNYIDNYNFVKEIFDKLDSINPDLINYYN